MDRGDKQMASSETKPHFQPTAIYYYHSKHVAIHEFDSAGRKAYVPNIDFAHSQCTTKIKRCMYV